MKKKILAFILAAAMLTAFVPVSATAVHSGTDGSLSWSVSDDTLTLSGSGQMPVHGPSGGLGEEAVVDFENSCDSASGSTFATAVDPLNSANTVWCYTGGGAWAYQPDYTVIQTGVEYTVDMRYYLPTIPADTSIAIAYYYGDGWKQVATLTEATSGWQALSYTFSTSQVGSVARFIQISGPEADTVELYLDDITITHAPVSTIVDYETSCDSLSGTAHFSSATDPFDSSNQVWSYTGGDSWCYRLDYNTIALNTVYTVSFRYYLATIPAGTEIKIGHYYSKWQCMQTLTAATDGWQEMRYTFSTSTNSGVYRFIEILGATAGTVELYLDDLTVSHGSSEAPTGVTAAYVDYSTGCNVPEPYDFSWTTDPDDETNQVMKYTGYDQYDASLMETVVGAEDGVAYTVTLRYKITDMGAASAIHLAYHMGGSMKNVKSFYAATDGWQTLSYTLTYDAHSSTKRFIELYAKTASGENTGNCGFYIDDIRISHERSFSEEEAAPWSESTYSKVVLCQGITSVGAYAFLSEDLTQITLPATVKVIRYGAFDPEGVTVYYNGTESQWKQVLCEMELTGATVVCMVDTYDMGDVNGDGEVSVLDLVKAKKEAMNAGTITGRAAQTAADMDYSQDISGNDVALLRQYLILDGILPAGPQTGHTVELTNELVAQALANYQKGSIAPYQTGYDEYAMNTVSLRWYSSDANARYTVKLSTNADLSDAEAYTTAKTELGLVNLMPQTTYYWSVSDGTNESAVSSFTTDSVIIRTINIPEGISNTRDLGGKATADGSMIKYGMVYRGANLDRISEAATVREMVEHLGIRSDIDLRGKEVELTASPLGERVNYYKYNCSRYMDGSHGINVEGAYRADMAEAIRQFADADNYPIYVHCAVGRDRTGTVCMLLEALLGVDETTLYMDYEFSLLSVAGTMDQPTPSSLLESFAEMLEYLKTFSDSGDLQEGTENYLLSIGITRDEIDSIRQLMLEE